jgi:hypothetical protein
MSNQAYKTLDEARSAAQKLFDAEPAAVGMTVYMTWGEMYIDRQLNCWDRNPNE